MKAATKAAVLGAIVILALLGSWTGLRAHDSARASDAISAGAPGVAGSTRPNHVRTAGTEPQAPQPRVQVPRFATHAKTTADAGVPRFTAGGSLLAQGHGHLRNTFPDGGGLEGPHALGRIEDTLDLMSERANRCLAGWQEIDPSLAKGVMLGVEIDERGLDEDYRPPPLRSRRRRRRAVVRDPEKSPAALIIRCCTSPICCPCR